MAGAVMYSGKWRIKPSGKLPVFLRFMINSSFDTRIARRVGFKHAIANRVYVNHMMYWPAKEYNAFETEIIERLNKDDGWLEFYCKSELNKSEKLYNHGLKLKHVNWKAKTNLEIKKILDDLLADYSELACPWYAQYSIDIFYEDIIQQLLIKHIKPDNPNFRHYVLVFTDPQQMTDVAEERWKLMKLAKDIKKGGENLGRLSDTALRKLNKHLDRFSYINRGLGTSKPYSMKDIVTRIREAWASKDSLDKLIYFSSPDKIKDDLSEVLKAVKPNAMLRRRIRQARLHSYTRNRRVEAFFLADYGASFMYDEIARRSGFNPDWVMEITVPEMYGALQGKPLPSTTEMKRRMHNYAMIVRNAKTTLICDPAQIKKLEKKYKVEVKDNVELRGKVACLGGIIRGRAKICLDKAEINKVRRGDILVAQFTTPDFVPAMEKASAVVADQGGLSSHAAIVSRELGVPCVIGTENGTRLIKDNDMLEVDAKHGVIKIINR